MEHTHFKLITRCGQEKFRESRSRTWQLSLAVVSGSAAAGRVCVSAHTTIRPCMTNTQSMLCGIMYVGMYCRWADSYRSNKLPVYLGR